MAARALSGALVGVVVEGPRRDVGQVGVLAALSKMVRATPATTIVSFGSRAAAVVRVVVMGSTSWLLVVVVALPGTHEVCSFFLEDYRLGCC